VSRELGSRESQERVHHEWSERDVYDSVNPRTGTGSQVMFRERVTAVRDMRAWFAVSVDYYYKQ
jgi:hypothetical protein